MRKRTLATLVALTLAAGEIRAAAFTRDAGPVSFHPSPVAENDRRLDLSLRD